MKKQASETYRVVLVVDSATQADLLAADLEHRPIWDSMSVFLSRRAAVDHLLEQQESRDSSRDCRWIVIVDIDSPSAEGFQLVEELRATSSLKSVPVLVLSRTDDQDRLGRSYDIGANAFVIRPKDSAGTIEVIEELISFWGNYNVHPPLRPESGKLPRYG